MILLVSAFMALPQLIKASGPEAPETQRDDERPEAGTYWEENKLFLAYDCSQPSEIRTVIPPKAVECNLDSPTSYVEERDFIILQETRYTTFPARRCTHRMSRFGYHCGMHSHVSVVPELWIMDQAIPVSTAHCRAWHNAGNDRGIDARVNHTSDQTRITIGQAYNNGGCKGGYYRPLDGSAGQDDMIVLQNDKVEAELLSLFKNREGQLFDKVNNRDFPKSCKLDDGECHLDSYRPYYWELDSRARQEVDCHLYKTRRVSGYLSTALNGGLFFVSNDSMVRLLITGTEPHCGTSVFGTNFPGIFLAEVDSPSILQREIDPAQLDMPTMMRQMDSFTFDTLRKERTIHLDQLRQQFCVEIQENDRLKYGARAAAQAAIADGETTALGDGYFAVAAGETFYEFRCPPITVWGVSLTSVFIGILQCYGSLKVVLQTKDLDRWLEARGMGPNDTVPDFFVEPRTHRLTTVGARIPCAPRLAPMYQNIHGQWMQIDGGRLNPAEPPSEMTVRIGGLSRPSPAIVDQQYDFSRGGTVDPSLVKALDSYYSIIRQGKSLPVELSSQMTFEGHAGGPEMIKVGNLFPTSALFTGGFLGWLFHEFREYALILFGIFATYYAITWILQLLAYCVRIQDHNSGHGRRRTPGWLHAFLPTQITGVYWKRKMKNQFRQQAQIKDDDKALNRQEVLAIRKDVDLLFTRCLELKTSLDQVVKHLPSPASLSSHPRSPPPAAPKLPLPGFPFGPTRVLDLGRSTQRLAGFDERVGLINNLPALPEDISIPPPRN